MEAAISAASEKEEVAVWMRRMAGSEAVRKKWEQDYRVEDCYNYWRGKQRRDEKDENGDRKAQHNKIHPDVEEALPALFFKAPYGKVLAFPERSDTPGETTNRKKQLLQDNGIALVRDPKTGFSENIEMALKESFWSIGCVEVGYEPDFIDNPLAPRPPLREGEDTKLGPPVTDEYGLSVDQDSEMALLQQELERLREAMRGERFYVKHIQAKQILISSSNKAILENNDYVGYSEDYPLEDVKASPAYQNTADLKAIDHMKGNDVDGSVDRVRLYRIWDLRTRTKIVMAHGHEKFLKREKFLRVPLKFFRHDVDPYNFFPIPPVYLKLPSQDGYNDSAEYLRRMRIGTVPRFTYDEDAVTPDQVEKFLSRDMNIAIPRKGGTTYPIEPVNQPSTSQAAIQTLGLSEKEFVQAGNASGDPLSPPTQTATRAVIANAKMDAKDDYKKEKVSNWVAAVIQELIELSIDYQTLPRWIAVNVDLDSPYAFQEAAAVAQTYQEIKGEQIRDAAVGIQWYVHVDIESLSPVSDEVMGQKLMQMIGFLSNPASAALVMNVPSLLKRMLALAGLRDGQDVDTIQQALQFIVQMNMAAASRGVGTPGISPQAGEPTAARTTPSGPPPPQPTPQLSTVAGGN